MCFQAISDILNVLAYSNWLGSTRFSDILKGILSNIMNSWLISSLLQTALLFLLLVSQWLDNFILLNFSVRDIDYLFK